MANRTVHIMLLLSLIFGGTLSTWSQAVMLSGQVEGETVAAPEKLTMSSHCQDMNNQDMKNHDMKNMSVVEVPKKVSMSPCQDKPCQCDDLGCHASTSVPADTRLPFLNLSNILPSFTDLTYLSILSAPAKRPPILFS